MTTIKYNQMYNVQWWNDGKLKETINKNAPYGVVTAWIRDNKNRYPGLLIQKAIN